jgi:hypothetical protein
MEHRLQTWLQVAPGDFLCDAIRYRRHSHIELHFDPVSPWVRLR